MTIPRKHSRPLEVDGRKFRYMIKDLSAPLPDFEESSEARKVMLTVQEDVEKPGRVLQARLPYGVPIGPERVAGIVRRALQGTKVSRWDPSERGEAFQMLY